MHQRPHPVVALVRVAQAEDGQLGGRERLVGGRLPGGDRAAGVLLP